MPECQLVYEPGQPAVLVFHAKVDTVIEEAPHMNGSAHAGKW
jgi:hypothetical protein